MGEPSNSIELYVRSKTAIYYTQPQCRGGGKGWVPEGGIGYADAHSSEHTLNDKESHLIEVLKEFSKKRHFVLNIHDLALKAETQRAFFKGISRTPVLIINGKRTYKMPATEQELALLFMTQKRSVMPPENDFSKVPVKVILYSKPKKVISTRPGPYDHCAVRGKEWATSTEETYSPGEELILKQLRAIHTSPISM